MTKDKEDATLTNVFLTCKSSLTRYIATFFVGREDIEDTVQETYLKALIAKETTDILSPKAFLFCVARNIALNKKARQEKIFMQNIGDFEDSIALQDEITPFDTLHSKEKWEAFCAAIDALPPQCRKIFLMQRVDGLSYKDIAKRLGISPRTVEKHLQKALQRCLEHLMMSGFYDTEAANVENIEDYRGRLSK